MAKRNNRTCICCGEKYRYCNSCQEDALKPSWYGIFHNENCKNIYTITNEYKSNNGNKLTKEEAKVLLDNCDLSYKDSLHHTIVETLNEIYKVEPVNEGDIHKTSMTEEKVESYNFESKKKFKK